VLPARPRGAGPTITVDMGDAKPRRDPSGAVARI